MLGVGLRLCVAVGALENRIISRISVTSRADTIRAPVFEREPSVIESCPLPTTSGVAGRAGSRELCSRVVWICRALIVRLVARVTIRGHGGVIVVHVTARARRSSVGARQREWRVVVVET
jgi:hypothetical protein